MQLVRFELQRAVISKLCDALNSKNTREGFMTSVPDHLQIQIGDLISECQNVVGFETVKTLIEHILCE